MTRTPTQLITVALVALIALAGSGCGQDDAAGTRDSSGASAGKSDADAAARAQAVKFSECMRGNGVEDFPDPNASNDFEYGISVSPEVWQQALAACRDLQPPGTLSGKRTAQEQTTALQFAACMRDNGVADFPDPVNGEPLVDTTKIPSSNVEGGMTILDAAMKACADLMADILGDRK